VEAHTREELTRAIDAGAEVVGVNARDLDTFAINTSAAWELIATIPANLVAVAESGMATRDDVVAAADAGANAVLIGSALAAAPDPATLAASLVGIPRRAR
jgi:indole-3-glycerol phosphate synthase